MYFDLLKQQQQKKNTHKTIVKPTKLLVENDKF